MSLELFIGPMKGGKSTMLIRSIVSYSDVISKNKKPLIINSILDTRNQLLSSHSSIFSLPDCCDIIKASTLSEVNVDDYDVIGIDESQFFSDLTEKVEEWLSKGKHLFCSGLNGNCKMQKFGKILDLIPLADNVTFVKAKCEICVEKFREENQREPLPTEVKNFEASFSARITKEDSEICVDAKYASVCRKHFKMIISNEDQIK